MFLLQCKCNSMKNTKAQDMLQNRQNSYNRAVKFFKR